ncbi:MAG TPA: hypothetical protein VNF50_11445 [Acidimicrobiales bacterium]|nr:hypothetical protein [Acidimicrobiales bacterium]
MGSIDFLRKTLTVDATINEVAGQLIEGRGKTANANRTITMPTYILDRCGQTRPIVRVRLWCRCGAGSCEQQI